MTDEVDETFDEIREYIRMTDGTVEDELGPDIQDGKEITGLRVGRAGYHYDVLGSPDMDYFLMRFGFNLLENLRNSGVEDPVSLLRTSDDVEMNKLMLNLMREISHPTVEVGLETTDDGVLAAFTVERKIFPRKDEFDVKDYEEAARAVVAQGDSGIKHIQLALDLRGMPDEETSQDQDKGFR